MNTKFVVKTKKEVQKIIRSYLTEEYFIWQLAEAMMEATNKGTSFEDFFNLLQERGKTIKVDITWTGNDEKVFIQDTIFYVQHMYDAAAFEGTYEECVKYGQEHNLNLDDVNSDWCIVSEDEYKARLQTNE